VVFGLTRAASTELKIPFSHAVTRHSGDMKLTESSHNPVRVSTMSTEKSTIAVSRRMAVASSVVVAAVSKKLHFIESWKKLGVFVCIGK
jgi:hypothetical protein